MPQDGVEWDSSCDSVRVHTMTSTELHRLDSRMSDPSGNFAKLTCIGPKLNTYRAIFSTCELIVSSFTTTTSNFIDLLSMANSQFLSGKFIVSHVSLWHKHSCASWSLFLTFIMAFTGPLNFSKLWLLLWIYRYILLFSFIIYSLNYFPDIFSILLFKSCYLEATDIFLRFSH